MQASWWSDSDVKQEPSTEPTPTAAKITVEDDEKIAKYDESAGYVDVDESQLDDVKTINSLNSDEDDEIPEAPEPVQVSSVGTRAQQSSFVENNESAPKQSSGPDPRLNGWFGFFSSRS